MTPERIISLAAKPSRFAAAVVLAFVCFSLYLLGQANILLGYKLLLLFVIAIFACAAGYSQRFPSWQKMDLLPYENKVVLWKNKQLPLVAKIDAITAFGNWVIILKVKLHNQSWRIILYYDSLKPAHYKQIKRLARWNR